MLKGIDLSKHQGSVDLPRVKRAGVRFVITKLSEGQDYIDPTWGGEGDSQSAKLARLKQRVEAIRKLGMVPAGYHYLRPRPGRSGAVEAKWAFQVYRAVGLGQPGDMVLWIDLEETELGPLETQMYLASFDAEWRRLWELDDQLGVKFRRCGLYSFPFFLLNLRLDRSHASRPLWIAHFGVRTPTIPPPFTDDAIWQHTSTGSLGGEFPVDLNVAELGDLPRLEAVAPRPEPAPEPAKLTPRQRTAARMRRARRKYLRTRNAKTLRVYLISKARLGRWDRRYCSYWGVDPNISADARRFVTAAYAHGLVATSTTGGRHATGSYHFRRDALGRGRGADVGNRKPLIGTAEGLERMQGHQLHEFEIRGRTNPQELIGPLNDKIVLRGSATVLGEGTALEQAHDTHVHWGK